MSFFDYFEAAYCINLDRRVDRWKRAQKQFKKINLNNVIRVSAVDGKLEPPASIPPGAVGCLKSHLGVFKDAKQKDLNSFLMLEDDVEFDDDFHNKFNEIESQIPEDFEMLYLGSNPHSGSRHGVKENINRVTYTFAAHSVIFRKPCFDDIINSLSGPLTVPCDVHYGRNQVVHTAYSIKPPLAWQKADYSDIDEQFVDYDFLRINI